jgi:hypothetical protein
MSGALQVYARGRAVSQDVVGFCYQGYHRLRFAFTNPEDAAVFKRAAQATERRKGVGVQPRHGPMT